VTELEENIAARVSILGSIREHLAASAPHDVVHAERGNEPPESLLETVQSNGSRPSAPFVEGEAAPSLIEVFRNNLEAVGGHCIIGRDEAEVVDALKGIVSSLQNSPLRGRRIALSDAPFLERLVKQMHVGVDEIAIMPSETDLFGYDIGISTAQAGIAETGTLMLDSQVERHRLVSLVPPVHIAIVEATDICLTLGEALAAARQDNSPSPAITFITGPSRTADIELTLAIGVHGPQELFVIINDGPAIAGSKRSAQVN
jgi:L-lactate dehydrogenase complex protein LldG